MSGKGHRTRSSTRERAKVDAGEQPGGTIGRYVIVSRLGAGAMGMVYLAYDPKLDRRLALKVLRRRMRSSRGAKERQQRLRREARAMGQLNHPHVVTVHDVGVAEGRVFLAMDYVPGQDLRQWLEARRRPWNKVLRTFIYAGRGLAAAHAAGVIHRDFKPENVLVGDDGSVKVMDFGLARASVDGTSRGSASAESRTSGEGPTSAGADAAAEEPEPRGSVADPVGVEAEADVVLTRSGDVLGTPSYMAPELFDGDEASAQTDQFAFCVALYEGLYGVRPFAGESMAALAFNMNRERITPPPRGSRVPVWLGRLVRRGLARDPGRRYPSMEVLLDALIQGAARRRLRRGGALAVGLVLAGGGLSYALVPSPTPCRAGRDRIGQVWNEERAGAIATAFEATGVPYADEALARAQQRLEDYAEAWIGVYTRVCEATAVHKHQTPAELDRRIACLDERLAELDALLEVLGEADRRVAEHAAQAVSELRGPGACASRSLVERAEAADPEHQRRVDILRGRLLRADALQNAGRYEDAAKVAREIAAEAELLGEVGLRCEALVQLGGAEDEAGNYESATEHLRQAYFVANEAGLDVLAAEAAVALIPAEGIHLAHGDEGLAWARHAEAAFERSDPESALRGRYHRWLGSLYLLRRFELDAAREHYQRALEIEREAVGEDHERVASLLAYLGSIQSELGRPEEAIASYDKALDITRRALGPVHPDLIVLHNNYAVVLYKSQDIRGAQVQLEKALYIAREALGEHPTTATALGNLGEILQQQGDYARSRPLIEESLAMRERVLGSDHPDLAHSLLNLARILEHEHDFEGARHHLELALSALEKEDGPDTPQVAGILAGLGMLALYEGEVERAHEQCQRALEIVESLLAAEHPERVEPLVCLGWARLERGQPEAALELLERADQLRALAAPRVAALLSLVLARALEQAEGDPERIERLREQGREQLAALGTDPPAPLAAWLASSPDHPRAAKDPP